MEQMSIFDVLYDKYKITKSIRLIELFAGYGSQALALKYLGVEFTHWRICEWATKSIQAYNDLHIRDYTDYSKDLKQNEVIERLATYGVSMNYNNPMTYEQIKRKGEKWQRQTYNNIIATHNLVNIANANAKDLNIANANAKDLNITNTKQYEYILTYSFPCQDLSIAGKCKGMGKESGTRSGMLWEVERLLEECEELPQVLLMENVSQIIGANNIKDFQAWQHKLEVLGYKNYVEVLNAKDFGIPQNRERCFMVSILGNYNYTFLKGERLKIVLKQMLTRNVEENFYINDKKANLIKNQLENKNTLIIDMIQAKREGKPREYNDIMPSLNARDYKEPRLVQAAQLEGNFESTGRVYSIDGLAPTINTCGGGQREPKILMFDVPQMVKVRKYPIDIEKLKITLREHKNTTISNIADSLNKSKTQVEHWFRNDDSFAIPDADIWLDLKKLLGIETDEFDKSIMTFEEREGIYEKANRCYHENGLAPTLTATAANEKILTSSNEPICLNPKVDGKQPSLQDRIYSDKGIATAITTSFLPSYAVNQKDSMVINGLRIRKLTPKECWRLMGVKDKDFENVAKNQSQSSLYHLAGDSIVTTPLMAMFGELLNIDWQPKIKELVNELVAVQKNVVNVLL